MVSCLGLGCPPQPSILEKHAAMLSHQHMHTSEKSCRQIVCADIEKEGGQDRSQREVVSQTSLPASLAVVISSEREASIPDKVHDHPDHVLIR